MATEHSGIADEMRNPFRMYDVWYDAQARINGDTWSAGAHFITSIAVSIRVADRS